MGDWGESEEDSDMDTGFYSDGEEPPSSKRRSLLVALRFVGVHQSTCRRAAAAPFRELELESF